MADETEDAAPEPERKKDRAKKAVRAVCTGKRQHGGRIVHPGDVVEFPGGIPDGYGDWFRPA